jgi:hypothetical protein
MREFIRFEHVDTVKDADHNPLCRNRIILCDPFRNILEIGLGRFSDQHSHTS